MKNLAYGLACMVVARRHAGREWQRRGKGARDDVGARSSKRLRCKPEGPTGASAQLPLAALSRVAINYVLAALLRNPINPKKAKDLKLQ